MNKRILIVLLLLNCTLFSFTQATFTKPRGDNQVVIITRIDSDANFQEDFFIQYYDIKSKVKNQQRPMKEELMKTMVSFIEDISSEITYLSVPFQDNVFTSLHMNVPKSRILRFPHTEIHPAGNKLLRIWLPFNFEIVIPEDTHYVYMGSFDYELEGIQYKVKKVTSFDEFEKASAYVKEKYGEDADLVRVPVTVIE